MSPHKTLHQFTALRPQASAGAGRGDTESLLGPLTLFSEWLATDCLLLVANA